MGGKTTDLIVKRSPPPLARSTKVTGYESLHTHIPGSVDELPLQLKLGKQKDRDDGVRALHELFQLVMSGRSHVDGSDSGTLRTEGLDVWFGDRDRPGGYNYILRDGNEKFSTDISTTITASR